VSNSLAGFVTNNTGGLSRLSCDVCGCETIHRSSVCIHCGGRHVAYRTTEVAYSRALHVTPLKGRRKR
jgi:hypothetical protein